MRMTKRTTTRAPATPPSTGPMRDWVGEEGGKVVVVPVVEADSVVELVVVVEVVVVVGEGEGVGLELWIGGDVLATSDDVVNSLRLEEKTLPLPTSRGDVSRSCITMVAVVGLGWAEGSREVVGARLIIEMF